MNKITIALATAAALSMPAFADNNATTKDAEALVGKVVKAVTADKTGTLKEITAKDPKWVNNTLYPFVLDSNGAILAHGGNEKMVGKNTMSLVDADGKYFGRELVEAPMAKGKAWIDYKYGDPVTKQVEPKSTYCEKTGTLIACVGIYKR
jgi:signal transduction histidine kinase